MIFSNKGFGNYIISVIVVIFLVFSVSWFWTSTAGKGVRSFLGFDIEDEDLSKYSAADSVAEISMKALTCAINSQVIGKAGWLEEEACGTYCPCFYTKAEGFTSTPTGAFLYNSFQSTKNRITGMVGEFSADNYVPDDIDFDEEYAALEQGTSTTKPPCSGIYYGDNICVECSGFDISFLSLSDQVGKATLSLADATIDCYDKLKGTQQPNKFTNCYIVDSSSLDQGRIINDRDLRAGIDMKGVAGKVLTGTDIDFSDKFSYHPGYDLQYSNRNRNGGFCIFYRAGSGHNTFDREVQWGPVFRGRSDQVVIDYCLSHEELVSANFKILDIVDDEDKALKQIYEAIDECYNGHEDRSTRINAQGNPVEYVRCSYINLRDVSKSANDFEISGGEIDNYLKNDAGVNGRFLGGHDIKFNNHLHVEPISSVNPTYCISYSSGDIYIGQCKDQYTTAFKCNVKGFELPQLIERKGWANPVRWVAGNGDPNYVAYYQSFPKGKAKFWHTDALSYVNMGMIAGFAVLDIIPMFGKGAKAVTESLKGGTEEATQQMMKKSVKVLVQEFFENLAQKGWKRAFRQSFLRETFQESFYGVGEKTAKAVAQEADDLLMGGNAIKRGIRRVKQMLSGDNQLKSELAESYYQILKKNSVRVPLAERAAISRAGGNAAEIYHRRIANEMAEQTIETYSKKLTKKVIREMTEKMAVKNFFKRMFEEGIQEGAEILSKEGIQDGIKKSLKQLGGMSWWQRRKAAQRGAELAENLLDNQGLLKFPFILGKEGIEEEKITLKFTQEFIDAIGVKEGDDLAEVMLKSGFQGLRKGTIGPHNPLRHPIKFFGSQLPLTFGGIRANKDKMVTWVRNHKYLVIGALAYLAASRDAMNEKYQPVGTNALGLDRPYMVGDNEGKVDSFALTDEAFEFFITPKLHKGERLYFASPCKADLVVSKEGCQCVTQMMDQHYSFGENQPIMDVSNIELKMHPEIDGILLVADDDKVWEWAMREMGYAQKLNEMSFEEAFEDVRKRIQEFWLQSNRRLETIKDIVYWPSIEAKYRDSYSKTYSDDFYFPYDRGEIADKEAAKKDLIVWYVRTYILYMYEQMVNGYAGVSLTHYLFDKYSYFFDTDNAIKNCYDRGFAEKVIGWGKVGYHIFTGSEIPVEQNPYLAKPITIPCISVSYQRLPTDDGINYCMDDYGITLPAIRWGLAIFEITTSVVLTAVFPVVSLPVIAGIGIASGLVEEWVARQYKWPAHHNQGFGQVPIAQGKVSDFEWSAWGGNDFD